MTRYHVLTEAELDAIGSGNLDAQVIEALLSGQYSKQVIMTTAILTAAAGRPPGEHARLEAAYDLLAEAHQADPSVVRALLTHPSYGRWTAHSLRRLQSAADARALAADLGRLTAFAAAAAIRAGHPFAIDIPLHDYRVFLPTLGLATFEPDSATAAHSPAWATVSHDGQRATITAGRGAVTLPADPSRDGPGWQGLHHLRACQNGLSITVEFDDLFPDWCTGERPATGRLTDDAVAEWQCLLNSAWVTLTGRHPRLAGALGAGARCVVPLKPAGKAAKSFTDVNGFGGHTLTPPRDPMSFAGTLIHEFHHSVLSAVADLAPLHAAGPDAVHYSPWRDDPRPIEGLLRGAYAYLGVTGFWGAQRGVLTGADRGVADLEFARGRDQVLETAQTLLKAGVLTDAGTTLVRAMARTVAGWHDSPVGEEPARLAERAALDHWVRWRMRNCHPPAAAIEAIARAWRDGQPCPWPPKEVPVTVVPRQSLLPSDERTRLLRLRLADPGRFHELRAVRSRPGLASSLAAEAGLAYACDDFERAAHGYRGGIEATHGDLESWSGFLLASAELPGRIPPQSTISPEIARCVYLTVLQATGSGPDPDKLLNWIGCREQAPLP